MSRRYLIRPEAPGRIRGVYVEMGHHFMETARIDLCKHPLYRELESYVLANLSEPLT